MILENEKEIECKHMTAIMPSLFCMLRNVNFVYEVNNIYISNITNLYYIFAYKKRFTPSHYKKIKLVILVWDQKKLLFTISFVFFYLSLIKWDLKQQ